MTAYAIYRLVFPLGWTQFLDTLQESVPQLHVPEELDEEGNVVQERSYLPSVVTTVRETLHAIRPATGEVVRVLEGEVTGKRAAMISWVEENPQRQKRDANGDLLWINTGETDEFGEPIRLPDMETLPGLHVDFRTNVPPETDAQTAALAAHVVTPTHPIKKYGAEVAA